MNSAKIGINKIEINEIARSMKRGEESLVFSEWLKVFLAKAGKENAEKCRELLAFLDSSKTDNDSGDVIAKAIEAIKSVKTMLGATAKQLESFGGGIEDNSMYRKIRDNEADIEGMILRLKQIDDFYDVLFNNAAKQISLSNNDEP